MKQATILELRELESMRGNHIIVYHSVLTDDSVRVLYECLRIHGRTPRLDLVLSTVGGSVTTARQVAILLREYAEYVTIMVPYRCWSAGTLLCLSANELILGPMAELGPIDSHIGSSNPPADAPGMISTEDVHAFRRMAEDWFGVERDEDRLQVLALVAQRVFPTTLSSFYRFDNLIRQIAGELLTYQIPDSPETTRQRIVDYLVGGCHTHDYKLSRAEVRELGLQARDASPEEEEVLWNLTQDLCTQPSAHGASEEEEGVYGFIASSDFQARRTFRRTGAHRRQRWWLPGRIAPTEVGTSIHWEIDT